MLDPAINRMESKSSTMSVEDVDAEASSLTPDVLFIDDVAHILRTLPVHHRAAATGRHIPHAGATEH